MSAVDMVLIGRNEGTRLEAALASAAGNAGQMVYVDSGSTDTSVAVARAAGVQVVPLEPSRPFTAARARNAGFSALDAPETVLFIDGDCSLAEGFVARAHAHLARHPELGLVTGWRRERHPRDSVYNRLCDWEWHRPAGPITTCGGDMMVRAEAWAALGGMTPDVVAAEDEEFCLRLAKAGWQLERLPLDMTYHDAAMYAFSQWWARAVRSGHGFAQVGGVHPAHFRRERTRAWVFGLVLPLLFLLGALVFWPLAACVGFAYALSTLRMWRRLLKEGVPPGDARLFAVLLTLSKAPNLIGMATYHWRRLRGADMRIIEYK